MKTIVLATDGSPSALKATDAAIELAAALHAALRVVSVWRMPVYDYGYIPMQYGPELEEAQRESAGGALEYAVAMAKAAGIDTTSDLRQGDAATEICDAAEAAHADMVVLGAHGWGAMKRILFGSVSTAVLHHAPCPVLVVRADPAQREHDVVTVHTARSGH